MSVTDIPNRIRSGEVLLLDGAWGTELHKAGLEPGDCPEEWNQSHPDEVQRIARAYYEAGARIGLTNTFGGSKFRLKQHGLGDQVTALNEAGARLCRSVADEFGAFLLGSVGPSGEYLEPKGLIPKSECFDAFRKQMEALQTGGAQAVLLETFSALDEIEQAILAAKDLGLFCMASMTFDGTSSGFKTMMGVSPKEAVEALQRFGADVVGTNCGRGTEDMIAIVREMKQYASVPLLVRSNAGLPKMKDGLAVYEESPDWMAQRFRQFVDAGATLIGGCCGTTPDHIRRFREELDKLGD